MSSLKTPLDAEDRRMLADTLGRFVQTSCELGERRARLRQGTVDHRLHWSSLAEFGLLALPIGQTDGGLSGCAVDVAAALRNLAPGLLLEPLIDAAVVAGRVLQCAPAGAARERALDALMAGDEITALIGGRVGADDALVAVASGARWRLSGRATVVPYAAQADRWLIAARAEGSGEPLILRTPCGYPGVKQQSFRLMDGRPACDVVFDGAVLDADTLWLRGEPARQALEQASLWAVSAHCADAVGVMTQLVDLTREYLQTRVQFGVAIGTFQALQHRLADMHMAVSEASAIATALARSLDGLGEDDPAWLRFAAASVIEQAATRVGHEAIQMHGGMGVTDELVVSHLNARLVVLTRLLCTWVPANVELPA